MKYIVLFFSFVMIGNCFAGPAVYVANQYDSIVTIEADHDFVVSHPVKFYNPCAQVLSADEQTWFIANNGEINEFPGFLSIVDLTTQEVYTYHSFAEYDFSRLSTVCLNADETILFVADAGNNAIVILDVTDIENVQLITVLDDPLEGFIFSEPTSLFFGEFGTIDEPYYVLLVANKDNDTIVVMDVTDVNAIADPQILNNDDNPEFEFSSPIFVETILGDENSLILVLNQTGGIDGNGSITEIAISGSGSIVTILDNSILDEGEPKYDFSNPASMRVKYFGEFPYAMFVNETGGADGLGSVVLFAIDDDHDTILPIIDNALLPEIQLNHPTSIDGLLSGFGLAILVTNYIGNSISFFTSESGISLTNESIEAFVFNGPLQITLGNEDFIFYILNAVGNSVFKINFTNGEMAIIENDIVQAKDMVVSSDNDILYAANFKGNTVNIIDLSGDDDTVVLRLTEYEFASPRALALSTDDTTLYVANYYGSEDELGSLIVLDVTDAELVQKISVIDTVTERFEFPIDLILIDDDTLYVVHEGNADVSTGFVSVFDVSDTENITLQSVLDDEEYGFHFPSAGLLIDTTLYVVNTYGGPEQEGSVTVINTQDNSLITVLDAVEYEFARPTHLAASANGEYLYVVNTQGGDIQGTITVIHTETYAVETILESSDFGLDYPSAIGRYNHSLYVASKNSDSVSVINAPDDYSVTMLQNDGDVRFAAPISMVAIHHTVFGGGFEEEPVAPNTGSDFANRIIEKYGA